MFASELDLFNEINLTYLLEQYYSLQAAMKAKIKPGVECMVKIDASTDRIICIDVSKNENINTSDMIMRYYLMGEILMSQGVWINMGQNFHSSFKYIKSCNIINFFSHFVRKPLKPTVIL
jgi:hypothetical protein